MSRKLLDKNFCVIPWTGFELEPNGNVKNCIISKDIIGNIEDLSIQEIISKNEALRSDMLSGKYPYNCSGCYLQEKNRTNNFDSISSRLYYAKNIGTKIPEGLLDNANNFKLKHVDLRWSNKCNQACVYCGPSYSSKWQQELGQPVTKPKDSIAKLKDYIYENIKDLENVYLAGGEPMLMKQNREFLERLHNENPNVMLRINTNLSHTDTGVFDLACKFKNVHWTISVEAIEEQYEYIRFHGVWKDFLHNLNAIKALGHRISFNMLYFVFNFKSIFPCIDLLQSKGFHPNSFVIGPLYEPHDLNILNLPKKTLDSIKSILVKRIDDKPGFLLQNSYENILSYLTETKFHANITATKQMIQKLDTRRGLDSTQVFPELYEVLNDH